MDEIQDLSNPVWRNPDFPAFYANGVALATLENLMRKEAKRMPKSSNFDDVFVSELLASSAIEGVLLSREKLKSSLLGNFLGSENKREKNAVQALQMAIEHHKKPLTHELIQQLNGLFNELPNSGQYVGGVNIVKSGRLDQMLIMDRGLPPEKVQEAMNQFVKMFNSQPKETPLLNAIAGHFHFEKIHPFSDGNGRTGRVLMNMALMRDYKLDHPLALSRAIQRENTAYYDCLGRNNLDLTQTVKDLAPVLSLAFKETERIVEITQYRKLSHGTGMNDRQRKAIDRLITFELENGYEGKFTSTKYEALTKTSESTSLRDLRELVKMGLLVKKGAMKGAHYVLALDKNAERGLEG